MSIRKALGAVKDQATIGIAKVSSAAAADLDVAVVRATAHDDGPPDERHVQEVLRLTSGASRAHVAACVATVSRRLARTRDYVVAAKCLALLHRLVADGDPHFRHELARPAARRAGSVLAALSGFRDEAHSASWDHSAFVRAYALYLDDRVRFLLALLPAPRTVRFADHDGYGYGYGRAAGGGEAPPPDMTVSVHDMDVEGLLARGLQLRQLIDRFLACRPTGAARRSRVVLATLWPVVKESARLYEDVAVVLAVLLDRFFDMEYPDCVRAFEAHVSTARLVDDLLAFYSWCDDAGVARSSDLPNVKPIDHKLLETLEQFVRERGRAGQSSSPPPRQLQHAVQEASRSEDEHRHAEYYHMNGIKALPAPEHINAATVARPRPAQASVPPVARAPEDQTSDLVDLRESAAAADEQGNKLALALFSEAPSQSANGSWVAFPSDDGAPKETTTSAWHTPAAETGKADWELALVETASNLSKQTAALGGGMDPLLLHGMYDQGAVRHHARAQAASGSASSVALPGTHNILALPGPDGVARGDPFAASLAVPPPSYVQMAEMERKQELLAQEQRMWAQYRQGGMQGQAGLNGVAVGGGGSAFASNTSVPMPMPMAYHGAGAYYY